MNLLRRTLFQISYFRRPPWDTGITPPELIEFLHTRPAGRALDLGCGNGTNAVTLAQHGWETTGVDFAWEAVRRARRKARQAGLKIHFFVGDVTDLGAIAGPFDLILDIGCFHGLPDPGRERYRYHLERLLAPQGTFLLYVHFRPDTRPSGHGVTEAQLARLTAHLRLARRVDSPGTAGHQAAWLTCHPLEATHA
jgi:SAM-dependent methyltransferase